MNCSYDKTLHSDLSAVVSIILSKTNTVEDTEFKEIAIINIAAPDKVDVKSSLGADVTGQLTAAGLSFIHYKWQYPGSEVEGKYRCTVAGLNNLGHPVELSHDGVIEEKSVDLQSVLDKIQTLEQHQQILTSTLNATRVQLLKTQSLLNTTQIQLNTTQSQLTTTQSQLNTTQLQLHKTQLDLTNTKIELNNTKDELSKTQITFQAALSFKFENSSLYYKNRVYLLSVLTPLNITSYQQSCVSLGGKLAEIRHQDEFDVIRDFLTKQHLTSYGIYLGLTDEGQEGEWRYMSDNSTLTFDKWYQ